MTTIAGRRSLLAARSAWPVLADALRVALLTCLFTSLLLLAVAIAPLAVGWQPHAVLSGSMLPAVPVGAVVVNARPAADEPLAAPSVITFPDPARAGVFVTHRIVNTVTDGGRVEYVTKGDANHFTDSAAVPHSAVTGVGRLVVPFAGLPAVWLGAGEWLALAGWGALLLAGAFTLMGLLEPTARRPRARR